MTNNTAVASTTVTALLAQIEENNRISRELLAVVAGLPVDDTAKDAAPVTTVTPTVVVAEKAVKAPTFTKGRLNDLKNLGIIPRGTSQKQALAGVDSTGKALSAEALEIIAACKAPTGGMKQHFHDLKESGAPRPVKVEKPAAPVVDATVEAKVLELMNGGFTAEEIKQILSIA